MIAGKPFAAAPHSALDLVQDQQDVFLIAQFPDLCQELRLRGIDPALSLNCFKKNCAGPVIYDRKHALKVVEVGKLHAAHQRLERILVMRVSGYGQGSDGPSVEGLVHGYDLVIVRTVLQEGVLSGCLDRTLNRLRAGVGEKHL